MVWFSQGFISSAGVLPLAHGKDREEAILVKMRLERGEPAASSEMPSSVWPKDHARKTQFLQLPDIFLAGSFWIVSGKAATVLQKFDLGRGSLTPVKLESRDSGVPVVDAPFFCLSIGNQKTAFVPDQSVELGRKIGPAYMIDGGVKDDELAVSSAALEGPDIWVDPTVFMSLFVSEELGIALKRAKAAKNFGLAHCRLVESAK